MTIFASQFYNYNVRGDRKSPLAFDTIDMITEKYIRELVEEKLDEIGGFIVDIKIQPNSKILVLIDKENGIVIKDCVQVSRHVESTLESEHPEVMETLGLEVSSPGLDYPLKHHRQYVKNVGRKVNVKLNNDSEKTGTLLKVSDESIEIAEELRQKGKKKVEINNAEIPFTNIKETKIVISFK